MSAPDRNGVPCVAPRSIARAQGHATLGRKPREHHPGIRSEHSSQRPADDRRSEEAEERASPTPEPAGIRCSACGYALKTRGELGELDGVIRRPLQDRCGLTRQRHPLPQDPAELPRRHASPRLHDLDPRPHPNHPLIKASYKPGREVRRSAPQAPRWRARRPGRGRGRRRPGPRQVSRPRCGRDRGALRADGGEQLAPCVRGTKVRAVRIEQLLGEQLIEGGADVGRIGLEEPWIWATRSSGACGMSAVRAARRATCCWNVLPCRARTCSRTPRAA